MRLVLLLLAGVVLWACDSSPPIEQPIQFSHKAHIDGGLACPVCHGTVEQAAAAGVPSVDTCMMCHQGALTESPEEEKVRQFAERAEPIPWRRIYDMPDHVFFSHRRHVVIARIGCGECHGAVETLVAPAAYPLVEHSMDWCLGCHAQRGATTDCVHCHR